MKRLIINPIAILLVFMLGWTTAKAQQIEVPGDNFSLEGALELFKKSATPQEFEQMLNDPDARVNNLDLNGDGYIDYMRVIDYNEGNVHAFVLQAVVSKNQSQDIAVITLEKRGNGEAVLQITGDADVYGVETIIEPTQEVRTYAGARSARVAINVWAWPSVRYIYGPHYSVWASPWGWHYRPHWWHAWRPVVYYDYYSYWNPYRRFYSPCVTHRVVYAHHIYRPHRTTSVIVHNRHHDRIIRYRSTHIDREGRYRPTTNRSVTRQVSRSARYDANGRIRSSSVQTARPRTISGTRSSERTSDNNARIQRSTENNYISRYKRSSDRETSSNSASQRPTSVQRNSATSGRIMDANRSTDSNARKSTSGSSTSRSSAIRPGSSRYESSPATDARRSYSSSSGNKQRSLPPANVQRSTGRSSGTSDIRRSSGSSSIQRSGGSAYQRSSSSSRSSGIQRSSGSSYRKSSTPSRSSSGIQRSSGRSGTQGSSANRTRSSSRSGSGSTSTESRGRR